MTKQINLLVLLRTQFTQFFDKITADAVIWKLFWGVLESQLKFLHIHV